MGDRRTELQARGESMAAMPCVLLDSRAAKTLEPLRLPSKLRERVDKAQRRVLAAKDGVSIFSAPSPSELGHGHGHGPRLSQSSSAARRDRDVDASGAEALEPELELERGGKRHLPQVVLRHKMREFETRMLVARERSPAAAAGTSGTLARLSLEDKERVMARMQHKIRAISDELEAGFARARAEMDARGVFAQAANAQRAQALCLVALQRRCRLDKLRDEAVDEVLGLGGKRARRNSSAFLAAPPRSVEAGEAPEAAELPSPQALEAAKRSPRGARPRQTMSQGRPRAAPLPRRDADADADADADMPRSATAPAAIGGGASPASPASRQRKRPAADEEPASSGGGGGGGGGGAGPSAADELASGAAADEVWTRHPHVLQALQALQTGKAPAAAADEAAEADAERDRQLPPADEWAARSASYRAIARRVATALWTRASRTRWDSTGHVAGLGVEAFAPSERLGKRLAAQQQRLLASVGGAEEAVAAVIEAEAQKEEEGSDLGAEQQQQQQGEEALAARRQRAEREYAALQAQVVERLAKRHARAARRRPPPRQAPPPSAEAGAEAPADRPALGQSASAPALPVSSSSSLSAAAAAAVTAADADAVPPSDAAPRSLLALDDRSGTRRRLSVLERRLLAGPSALSRRRGRRETRVGEPPRVASASGFGRHSDARMAERRASAQTWAWHARGGVGGEEGGDEEQERGASDGASDEELGAADGALLEETDEEDEESEEGEERERERRGRGDRSLRATDSGLSSLATSRLGDDGGDSEDARSVGSCVPQSARSVSSAASASRRRRRSRSRRAAARSGGARSAALSGDALSLFGRLEAVWRALEFPFSRKLLMVEALADRADADAGALARALGPWEACVTAVRVRERMKSALAEFADRQALRDGARLAPDELAALAAALAADDRGEVDAQRVGALADDDYVAWVRDHIDGATAWCAREAAALRAATGDELEFQGVPYPRQGGGAVGSPKD